MRFGVTNYKEGNNRPSSVNQIPLVHNHDKAGNKCYTQDNTNTRENPSRVKSGVCNAHQQRTRSPLYDVNVPTTVELTLVGIISKT